MEWTAIDIAKNIQDIYQRIENAESKRKYDIGETILVAVTKNVDESKIIQAINANITNIGENRVQELNNKFDKIDKAVNWHMIGSLQTNKVKYIIDKVKLIHSLDRLSLAKEINKRAETIDKIIPVLVQINIGKEDTKSGLYEEDVIDFIYKMEQFPYVKVMGLMTVAPLVSDKQEARPFFSKMRHLFYQVQSLGLSHVEMKYLSMGMTNDFEIAIEEGANIVRIGKAIFGERIY